MEPEQQPMEVHDPSKIPLIPKPAPDDYAAAARASVLSGAIPEGALPLRPAEQGQETLVIPPKGSLATEETDKGPVEATEEKVGEGRDMGLKCL
jgi:hypothetical protein